ncbi:MAG: PDDEXK nuclease domain-containing protein [Paludibacteraceae bacterium]|nr:PDDEXK nuclease domain-containing protein [Paludibacteraceae bacterium]
MATSNEMQQSYIKAAETIKNAILSAQYEAARGVNNIQLMLYYSVGRFISHYSRKAQWGTAAIASISHLLTHDMPGLRGFSEANIKKMRTFYEEWRELDAQTPEAKSLIQTSDLPEINSLIQMNEIQILPFNFPSTDAFPGNDFRSIGFTHHTNILIGTKSRQERMFYISLCAREHLTPDGIKNCIRQNLYAQRGELPNNFLQKLPSGSLAKRAILAFKDQYMLDFINVEELGARDIEEVNETVVEQKIVDNIKQFILRFGKDFLFVGNQYTLNIHGHEHRIDLLFFNRELDCLVAIELKTGPFKQIYLGELNGYLRLLDDFVRKPHENPSIGIVLCKSADKSYVEYMIQDYDKPMGVATYKTATDMPERLRKALPDQEELLKIIGSELNNNNK